MAEKQCLTQSFSSLFPRLEDEVPTERQTLPPHVFDEDNLKPTALNVHAKRILYSASASAGGKKNGNQKWSANPSNPSTKPQNQSRSVGIKCPQSEIMETFNKSYWIEQKKRSIMNERQRLPDRKSRGSEPPLPSSNRVVMKPTIPKEPNFIPFRRRVKLKSTMELTL